jgi:hypothetical protein
MEIRNSVTTTEELQTLVLAKGLKQSPSAKSFKAAALVALQDWVKPEQPCPHCGKLASDPPESSNTSTKTHEKVVKLTPIPPPTAAVEDLLPLIREAVKEEIFAYGESVSLAASAAVLERAAKAIERLEQLNSDALQIAADARRDRERNKGVLRGRRGANKRAKGGAGQAGGG